MSDTPRTDRDTHTYGDASVEWRGEWIPACACRIIERELNAANDRIKRLEEELDRFTCVVELTPMKWSRSLQEAFDMARAVLKAKEAKP